jgi:hypothetical protein
VVFFRAGQGSRLAAATLPFVVRTPLAFVMPMLVPVLAGIERQTGIEHHRY